MSESVWLYAAYETSYMFFKACLHYVGTFENSFNMLADDAHLNAQQFSRQYSKSICHAHIVCSMCKRF